MRDAFCKYENCCWIDVWIVSICKMAYDSGLHCVWVWCCWWPLVRPCSSREWKRSHMLHIGHIGLNCESPANSHGLIKTYVAVEWIGIVVATARKRNFSPLLRKCSVIWLGLGLRPFVAAIIINEPLVLWCHLRLATSLIKLIFMKLILFH